MTFVLHWLDNLDWEYCTRLIAINVVFYLDFLNFYCAKKFLNSCKRCVPLFPPLQNVKCSIAISLKDGCSLPEQFVETLPCFLHLRGHLTRCSYSRSGIMALLCTQGWVTGTWEFLKHGGCATSHLSGNVHTAHMRLAHRPCFLPCPECWVSVIWGSVGRLVCFLSFTVTERVGSNMRVCKHGSNHQALNIKRIPFLCLTSFVKVALIFMRSVWQILSW